MFSAELAALGTIIKTAFSQGGLFFTEYIGDPSTPETKWYLLILSAVICYSFVEILTTRRRRR